MQIPLLRGDKVDDNVDYRDALPVNMYAVPYPIKGANGYMNQWFGLTKVADGQGIDRGGIWVARTGFTGHYRVSGESLIQVNADSTVTVIGSIAGTDKVSMAYSFNNLAIVASKRLYYYSPTDGLRRITGTYVGLPLDIVWADSLFILTDGDNTYHSNPLDETDFLPLDYKDAQFRPDPSYGLGVNEDNELLVFGQLSIEPYRNIGNANFVYQRITSKFLKLGIAGTQARTEMGGFWYVLGRRDKTSFALHQVRSGGEKKISTREIDKILSTYSEDEIKTTVLEAFTKDDIKLVLIHLPDKTIVYNETVAEALGKNSAFSIIKTDVTGKETYRGINFVNDLGLGEWVGGDKRDSSIGYLDASVATHYDDVSEWEIYTPLIKLESLSIDELELNTISGFAPDNDATVAISMTADGHFYSNESWQLYTDNQTYNQRFILNRIGMMENDISFKFRGASRSRMNVSLLNIKAQ